MGKIVPLAGPDHQEAARRVGEQIGPQAGQRRALGDTAESGVHGGEDGPGVRRFLLGTQTHATTVAGGAGAPQTIRSPPRPCGKEGG